MRLAFGVVLCLFAVLWGSGCRKALTPNVSANQAPETWITAAPMDSITVKTPTGIPIKQDDGPRRIPVRFHLYWAGSDPDGAVVGFYWAVTETTATPIPGLDVLPPVPGPKPSDYHYTTKTDSSFIFSVSSSAPDRQHAFFIYAVDNEGKADPTPARFFFTAIDRFPPIPYFTLARATGTIFTNDCAGNVTPHQVVKDFNDISDPHTQPRDTVSVNSRLDFAWNGRLGVAGNYIKQWCYKLVEPAFACVDSSVHSASYNTHLPRALPVTAGQQVFTVRAVDIAGGTSDSTRRVYMNYAPDSWFWGPDPNDPNFTPGPDALGDRHYINVSGVNLASWPGIPGTGMSPDSFKIMPNCRPERRTFFEIWNGKVYARSEGDTVHMNSWAVFYSGGYDKDSDYKVKVDFTDPALPADTADAPVITPHPANGSPIGFRSAVTIKADLFGSFSQFSPTGLFPVYQPTSVFRLTQIGAYWPMFVSGRAFVVTRAEDGDELVDSTVPGDPAAVVSDIESGNGTPQEIFYRRKILTFWVNRSPFLQTCDPTFVPKDPARQCGGPAPLDTTTFASNSWNLYLPADDVDPFDPGQPNRPRGVPTTTKVLRYQVTVKGQDFNSGRDTTAVYYPSGPGTDPHFFQPQVLNFVVPAYIAGGVVTVEIQLCDCVNCEVNSGEGRCVTYDFPVKYIRPPIPEYASSAGRGSSR